MIRKIPDNDLRGEVQRIYEKIAFAPRQAEAWPAEQTRLGPSSQANCAAAL